MNPKPIGLLFQYPSSRDPPVRVVVAVPLLQRTVAFAGGVVKVFLGVIHVAEKLPALKPEFIVAGVPGQTPLADVVTVAEGRG